MQQMRVYSARDIREELGVHGLLVVGGALQLILQPHYFLRVLNEFREKQVSSFEEEK